MNKLTTIYLCKDNQLLDLTATQLSTKHKSVLIYDNGVLIRKEDSNTTLDLLNKQSFDEVIQRESIHTILKNVPNDKIHEYTGVVKSILVLQDNINMKTLRHLSHKKMINVNYL